MARTWRLGTRGSLLARTQSGQVADLIRQASGDEVELVIIRTRGDEVVDRPLAAVGGKGLFTAELEEGLRRSSIDLAVHSLKDLPSDEPAGLILGAIPARGDARDAMIGSTLSGLRQGAVVGTGSERRRMQLLAVRPDLELRGLRGNVDTRLNRQQQGDFDAVVLAAAGLVRIEREARITELLDVDTVVPAAGQGALAVQCREDDVALREVLGAVHDHRTARAVEAERAFLAALQGGCSVPAACHVVFEGVEAVLRAFFADGGRTWRETWRGPTEELVQVAQNLGLRWRREGRPQQGGAW